MSPIKTGFLISPENTESKQQNKADLISVKGQDKRVSIKTILPFKENQHKSSGLPS